MLRRIWNSLPNFLQLEDGDGVNSNLEMVRETDVESGLEGAGRRSSGGTPRGSDNKTGSEDDYDKEDEEGEDYNDDEGRSDDEMEEQSIRPYLSFHDMSEKDRLMITEGIMTYSDCATLELTKAEMLKLLKDEETRIFQTGPGGVELNCAPRDATQYKRVMFAGRLVASSESPNLAFSFDAFNNAQKYDTSFPTGHAIDYILLENTIPSNLIPHGFTLEFSHVDFMKRRKVFLARAGMLKRRTHPGELMILFQSSLEDSHSFSKYVTIQHTAGGPLVKFKRDDPLYIALLSNSLLREDFPISVFLDDPVTPEISHPLSSSLSYEEATNFSQSAPQRYPSSSSSAQKPETTAFTNQDFTQNSNQLAMSKRTLATDAIILILLMGKWGTDTESKTMQKALCRAFKTHRRSHYVGPHFLWIWLRRSISKMARPFQLGDYLPLIIKPEWDDTPEMCLTKTKNLSEVCTRSSLSTFIRMWIRT